MGTQDPLLVDSVLILARTMADIADDKTPVTRVFVEHMPYLHGSGTTESEIYSIQRKLEETNKTNDKNNEQFVQAIKIISEWCKDMSDKIVELENRDTTGD
jgi:hypothetical protein